MASAGTSRRAKPEHRASAAQLEAIRLSSQAQMATAYLQLIITDRQVRQLEESEALLAESLRLTQNQFAVGIVSDADVAQAESQYKTAQAATVDMKLARSQLEHAIAVSIGQAPSTLTIDMAKADPYLPQIPAGLPSTLLQRRPDVASAERKVAQANALIGVANRPSSRPCPSPLAGSAIPRLATSSPCLTASGQSARKSPCPSSMQACAVPRPIRPSPSMTKPSPPTARKS